MRRRHCLILFLKLPRLGAVKTRLGREIGAGAARAAYRVWSDGAIRRLAGDRRWRTVLAITPPRGRWRSWRGLDRVPQGPGDLGQRMRRCLIRFARPCAVLVGTDIPALTAAVVAPAFRALGRADFVFGPAEDGGYWLIGWHRRRAWPLGALDKVRWSSPETAQDSVASLGPLRAHGLVDRLADVDDLSDFLRWRRESQGRA